MRAHIEADSINGLLEQTEGRVEERDQRFKRREKRFEDWERGESARLEIEVVARTRKLRESNEKLKLEVDEAIAVNQAQTRFIANMIHEIRTPMNGVLGITEMLSHTDRAHTAAIAVYAGRSGVGRRPARNHQ